MPRSLAAIELAKLFGVLAHPLRIQIIEELRDRELTVNELQNALSVAHASVSQHLAILRSNKVVVERRQGRHVHYHLRNPEIARIVARCLLFVSPDTVESERILSAIESAKSLWDVEEPTRTDKAQAGE